MGSRTGPVAQQSVKGCVVGSQDSYEAPAGGCSRGGAARQQAALGGADGFVVVARATAARPQPPALTPLPTSGAAPGGPAGSLASKQELGAPGWAAQESEGKKINACFPTSHIMLSKF